MTPERWRRANQLFHSACQLAPEERAAFIETSCADDEPLRLKLLAMLDAAQEDDTNFPRPSGKRRPTRYQSQKAPKSQKSNWPPGNGSVITKS